MQCIKSVSIVQTCHRAICWKMDMHSVRSNQIKSNQIKFKFGNEHLKEMKISKKLFT